MAKRKIAFIASLVIAVSICSICSIVPAYASTENGYHKITVTTDMCEKNADGSVKTQAAISYGGFDADKATKEIVIQHKFKESEKDYWRSECSEIGLDFDKLYNGYDGIAADYGESGVFGMAPRYGWKALNYNNKTFWGYCSDLNAGWIKSSWAHIGDKWYYFNRYGTALCSTTQLIKGVNYTFGADCAWIQ